MIVSSEIGNQNQADMVAFYKANFLSVERVDCAKCKQPLVLEMYGGDSLGIAPDADGKVRVNLGGRLISYRIRLDETPTGAPMVGYQCECGNDTRISTIEEEIMPEGPQHKGLTSLDPYTRQKIKDLIRESDYKPEYKDDGQVKTIETFKVIKV